MDSRQALAILADLHQRKGERAAEAYARKYADYYKQLSYNARNRRGTRGQAND